jgi:hypothetical protein
MRKRLFFIRLAALCAAGAAGIAAAAPPAAYREITWEALVPKDWDPLQALQGQDISQLSDTDPRAEQLLKQLRQAWDNAPTNRQMAGQAVRLPGYLVPLEQSRGQLREFLLVPYFGACIHSPPPPSNQVVHVVLAQPARRLESMDVVWASGVLRIQRDSSSMGVSSYRLEAAQVQPYEPTQK